jgi:hypothetical protein
MLTRNFSYIRTQGYAIICLRISTSLTHRPFYRLEANLVQVYRKRRTQPSRRSLGLKAYASLSYRLLEYRITLLQRT